MPRITFLNDVPNPDGDGNLYTAGYQADVSEATAQKWVRAGHAKLGAHEITKAKPVKRKLELRTVDLKEADLSTASLKPVAE